MPPEPPRQAVYFLGGGRCGHHVESFKLVDIADAADSLAALVYAAMVLENESAFFW